MKYGIKQIKAYSEIPFRNKPYYIKTSQMSWVEDQLSGFSMIRGFTEMCLYWKVWLVLQGFQIVCSLPEDQQLRRLLSCRFSY